jgi:hypothetical protein
MIARKRNAHNRLDVLVFKRRMTVALALITAAAVIASSSAYYGVANTGLGIVFGIAALGWIRVLLGAYHWMRGRPVNSSSVPDMTIAHVIGTPSPAHAFQAGEVRNGQPSASATQTNFRG